MFVEHTLTEGAKLFPFVTAVLQPGSAQRWQAICRITYNELFVSYCNREIAIESDAEVVRVVSLVSHYVLQKRRLVSKNL